MTKIAFAALPAYGHVYPMLPLAEAFQRAGAEVSVAVGAPFLGALPLPTVPGLAGTVTLDEVVAEVLERFPQTADDMANRWLPAFFGNVNARRVLPALREQWAADRPGLVVYEVLDPAAALAAGEIGVPSVAFGLGQWLPALARLVAVAADAVAPGGPSGMPWEVAEAADERPGCYVDPMPASLQPGPVGTILDRMPIRPDGWHDLSAGGGDVPARRPDGPPRIYVTLGTVAYGAVDVLRQAVVEAASFDAEVVVACGPDGNPELLGSLPPNVRTYRYLPQWALLPGVDLIVHHGGAGTMLQAAWHGIPQVILPQGADQFVNAQSVQDAGVGRQIGKAAMAPGAVAIAVGALLGDGAERQAAAALAAEIAALPAPDEVAEALLARL